MAVGLKEIASELNLGVSTVAQALAGTGTVSPRTRQLVIEHAQKVGYTPNRHAQRMRGGHTGAIGLIVPDVVLSPYVEVVQHLFQMLEGRGSELQISLTEFYPNLEDRAFRSLVASRVDGIIAKVSYSRWEDVPSEHYFRRAKADGIPIVLYSNPIEGSGLPYLVHPLEASTRLVVRHLLALGHRRFAAFAPASRPFGAQMQRWLATIREELAKAGTGAELELCAPGGSGMGLEGPLGVFRDYMNQNHPRYAIPVGRELFRQAMELDRRPTALLTYADPVAVGAVFEAQARGIRVGRDIAIAGCGQMATSFFSPISLTTVDRRPQLFAETLVKLLEAHMDESRRPQAPTHAEVEPLLVIGESTVGA